MTSPPGEVAADLPFDPIAVVTGAPAKQWTRDGVTNIGPLAQNLPAGLQDMLGGRADVIALSGVLWGAVSQLFNKLGPLQVTAQELPGIVAHSDEVHDALQQGQDAIGRAVVAVQAAAQSLTSSLSGVSTLVAQAYAAAAQANSRVTAHDGRLAALEARAPRLWRASGDLPALAVNATTTVTCPWASAPPAAPSASQCVAVLGAGGAAAVTVTSTSPSGAVVSVKALSVVLAAPGAVQVVGATW